MSEQLLDRYRNALSAHDLGALTGHGADYSNLFLPMPLPLYGQSGFRLMVVGQETRGWNGKLDSFFGTAKDCGLDAYLEQSANAYQHTRVMKPGRIRFFQFLHEVEQGADLERHEVHWANLFACAYRKKSALARPADEVSDLATLSQMILAAQIDCLRPDAILFATGPDYDSHLKALCNNHFGGYDNSEVIKPRRLWTFQIGSISCYRTTHPRFAAGRNYRRKAIEMICSQKHV